MKFRSISVRLYISQIAIYIFVLCLFIVTSVILVIWQEELVVGGDATLLIVFFTGPFSAFFFICIILVSIDFFGKIITIDVLGIEYTSLRRKYFINWDDLKMVGTAYEQSRTQWQGLGPRLIYFDAHGLGRQDFVYWKATDEKFFVVCYRHKIWEEVQEYWDGELMEARVQ